MNLFYNINFDISGVIILLILIVVLRILYDNQNTTTKKFIVFTKVALFSGIMDIVTAFTDSNAASVPAQLNLILNSIYLISASSAAMLLGSYVRSTIKYISIPNIILDQIVAAAYTILLIFNFFTGIIFDFNNGTYNHGPLFYLNFFVPIFYLLHNIVVIIYKYKSFNKKQKILNYTIIFFPMIAVALQIIYPAYLLTFFSYTLFTLVILFAQETPDFIELNYLRKNLEDEVKKQTDQLRKRERQIDLMSQEATQALASAIDEKDEYTNGHSARVSVYSMLLAQALDWDIDKVENIRIAALLHDVGKIGIPDSILKKPGKLSLEEYMEIQKHTVKGAKILHNLTTIPNAEAVAKYHHERFDGTGYPEKLAGTNIPEFARIVSIADSYDAMNSKRIYRNNLPSEEVLLRLKQGSGTQFDPELLEVFLKLIDDGIIY